MTSMECGGGEGEAGEGGRTELDLDRSMRGHKKQVTWEVENTSLLGCFQGANLQGAETKKVNSQGRY